MKQNLSSSPSLKGERKLYVVVGLISAFVLGFLFWLIYFKAPSTSDPTDLSWVNSLPAFNAFFNSLTAILLILGFIQIRLGRKKQHIKSMLSAVFTSTLFLVSYILYHHYHGDTKFLAIGFIRPIYFFILISHILLSVIQVPLILITLFFAWKQRWSRHRFFARLTFPIWLYVSVTGVLIFVFLKLFNS